MNVQYLQGQSGEIISRSQTETPDYKPQRRLEIQRFSQTHSLFPQMSLIFRQMNLIFPPKSPTFFVKERILVCTQTIQKTSPKEVNMFAEETRISQKSLEFLQISPVCPPKRPIFKPKSPMRLKSHASLQTGPVVRVYR